MGRVWIEGSRKHGKTWERKDQNAISTFLEVVIFEWLGIRPNYTVLFCFSLHLFPNWVQFKKTFLEFFLPSDLILRKFFPVSESNSFIGKWL